MSTLARRYIGLVICGGTLAFVPAILAPRLSQAGGILCVFDSLVGQFGDEGQPALDKRNTLGKLPVYSSGVLKAVSARDADYRLRLGFLAVRVENKGAAAGDQGRFQCRQHSRFYIAVLRLPFLCAQVVARSASSAAVGT